MSAQPCLPPFAQTLVRPNRTNRAWVPDRPGDGSGTAVATQAGKGTAGCADQGKVIHRSVSRQEKSGRMTLRGLV